MNRCKLGPKQLATIGQSSEIESNVSRSNPSFLKSPSLPQHAVGDDCSREHVLDVESLYMLLSRDFVVASTESSKGSGEQPVGHTADSGNGSLYW